MRQRRNILEGCWAAHKMDRELDLDKNRTGVAPGVLRAEPYPQWERICSDSFFVFLLSVSLGLEVQGKRTLLYWPGSNVYLRFQGGARTLGDSHSTTTPREGVVMPQVEMKVMWWRTMTATILSTPVNDGVTENGTPTPFSPGRISIQPMPGPALGTGRRGE